MREEKAASLRDTEDLVLSTLGDKAACFRGQSRASWDLVPSAYRSLIPLIGNPDFNQNWPEPVERDTYREFEIQARQSFDQRYDFLERLSIAQHHGIPTRFLDWTSKLEIAAYFSVCEGDEEDCAIWCLNLSDFPFSKGLGRQHPGGGFRLENIKEYGCGIFPSFAQPVSGRTPWPSLSRPRSQSAPPDDTFLVWKPARVDERLRRQEGLLSWHHSFTDRGDLVWNYSISKSLRLVAAKSCCAKLSFLPKIDSDFVQRF
jgi:hypothetical protein